jgi:hypothetical protein
MSHPWSDDIGEDSRLRDEIPDERYRPDIDSEDEGVTEIERKDSPDCPIAQRFECLKDALKLFRNKFDSDRSYLIWIARYFLQLKFNAMEEIFRLDSSNLCRVSRRAERNLRIDGI